MRITVEIGKMYRTNELLDNLKSTFHLTSDYAIAKKLGVSTSSIYTYRAKRSFFDVKMCFDVAELLDLDPLELIACSHLERAERSGDEKLISYWEQRVH